MLGRDVQAAAASGGHEPVALPHAALDITDRDAVVTAVGAARPDAVINCAAYTNVDGAESDLATADAVNAHGAGHVSSAAATAGAWTIHVSSDYVFDGSKRTPYVESDRVAPQSAYGRSKLAGERAVASGAPVGHTIVRSSWLFGAGGACFPATILRLATERAELEVVDDQRGCPTFTGHLAPALIALAEQRPIGVLHVAGAGECSWFEFAREIVARSGQICEVRPTVSAAMPRPAARPAYSVLRSERPLEAPALPHWREGLSEFMSAKVGRS